MRTICFTAYRTNVSKSLFFRFSVSLTSDFCDFFKNFHIQFKLWEKGAYRSQLFDFTLDSFQNDHVFLVFFDFSLPLVSANLIYLYRFLKQINCWFRGNSDSLEIFFNQSFFGNSNFAKKNFIQFFKLFFSNFLIFCNFVKTYTEVTPGITFAHATSASVTVVLQKLHFVKNYGKIDILPSQRHCDVPIWGRHIGND